MEREKTGQAKLPKVPIRTRSALPLPSYIEEAREIEGCTESDKVKLEIMEMEMHHNCDTCGQVWRELMELECTECGEGVY